MGSYSRRLSRTQRRWSTRHQIDMAWLAAPGRPQRDVAIHGDDLCATSVITPCVQSANLRGTHSSLRRGIHSANSFTEIPAVIDVIDRRYSYFTVLYTLSMKPLFFSSVSKLSS